MYIIYIILAVQRAFLKLELFKWDFQLTSQPKCCHIRLRYKKGKKSGCMLVNVTERTAPSCGHIFETIITQNTEQVNVSTLHKGHVFFPRRFLIFSFVEKDATENVQTYRRVLSCELGGESVSVSG